MKILGKRITKLQFAALFIILIMVLSAVAGFILLVFGQ